MENNELLGLSQMQHDFLDLLEALAPADGVIGQHRKDSFDAMLGVNSEALQGNPELITQDHLDRIVIVSRFISGPLGSFDWINFDGEDSKIETLYDEARSGVDTERLKVIFEELKSIIGTRDETSPGDIYADRPDDYGKRMVKASQVLARIEGKEMSKSVPFKMSHRMSAAVDTITRQG